MNNVVSYVSLFSGSPHCRSLIWGALHTCRGEAPYLLQGLDEHALLVPFGAFQCLNLIQIDRWFLTRPPGWMVLKSSKPLLEHALCSPGNAHKGTTDSALPPGQGLPADPLSKGLLTPRLVLGTIRTIGNAHSQDRMDTIQPQDVTGATRMCFRKSFSGTRHL
jgi:hypothetical protein